MFSHAKFVPYELCISSIKTAIVSPLVFAQLMRAPIPYHLILYNRRYKARPQDWILHWFSLRRSLLFSWHRFGEGGQTSPIGAILGTIVMLTVIHLKLPLYVMFVGSAISGLSGFLTVLSIAVMSYTVDTTEKTAIARYCLHASFWAHLAKQHCGRAS